MLTIRLPAKWYSLLISLLLTLLVNPVDGEMLVNKHKAERQGMSLKLDRGLKLSDAESYCFRVYCMESITGSIFSLIGGGASFYLLLITLFPFHDHYYRDSKSRAPYLLGFLAIAGYSVGENEEVNEPGQIIILENNNCSQALGESVEGYACF